MVVDIYIIGPKKDQFKPVFFGLFDFSKMKRPRPRLQKNNKQFFSVLVLLVLVQFSCSLLPVLGLDFQTLGISVTRSTESCFKDGGEDDGMGASGGQVG